MAIDNNKQLGSDFNKKNNMDNNQVTPKPSQGQPNNGRTNSPSSVIYGESPKKADNTSKKY